jgi:maltose alpha-D-glucosyltransferase/alpha-amylase
VLARGEDFVIIDFEGEPGRPPAERRAKSSPVRDVMGMVRSFDYAPESVLRDRAGAGAEDRARWEPAAARWTREVTDRYLAGYRATVGGTPILPRTSAQLSLLFTFYELEKVIYELGYELNNRPDWVEIPLRGLTRILRAAPGAAPAGSTASAEPNA